jgi:putative transposase
MPEHFHLLITEPQTGTPSTVMQALKLGFARRVLAGGLNRVGANQPVVRNRHAHVWQRRFYDFNVRTERKRIEKLRYIHRNPVTRGLVTEPDQWQWSSFRSYAFDEAGPVRINDSQLLEMKIQPQD